MGNFIGWEHPRYGEWKQAVENDETVLGLRDWLEGNPTDEDEAEVTRLRLWCEDNGVSVVQAQEPEVFGMWDWLDGSGNACDQSFDTEREAMQNAYDVFNS